jgi:hypothetical protein
MDEFNIDDLLHLLGHADEINVALRDVSDDEKARFQLIDALCTPNLRVFAHVGNPRRLLLYSPTAPVDAVRAAADELSRRTHQPSVAVPVTDQQLDDLVAVHGLEQFKLEFSHHCGNNFHLLPSASTKTLRVFVNRDFSVAKVYFPHHTRTQAERLFRRFLERKAARDRQSKLARAQANGDVAVEAALCDAVALLEINSKDM